MFDFRQYPYIPILGVRNSEMRALEELPGEAKDTILPLIILQRWVGSNSFEKTLSRVDAAINGRPAIVDVTRIVGPTGDKRKSVHDTIDALRDPADGYRNWYQFIANHQNFIPTIQIQNPTLIQTQIPRLMSLDRGGVVRLPEAILGYADEVASQIASVAPQEPFHFILDFQHKRRDILTQIASTVGIIRSVQRRLPFATFSVAASTFPSSLVDIADQDIYERQFHDLVLAEIGKDHLVYSDRASVRAEQGGGGGTPAPRVDFPLADKWLFFRQPNFDEDDKQEAYQAAALDALASPHWEDLNIWGTGQIVLTSEGQRAIVSPAASTAVRIHLHMYRQSRLSPGPVEKLWTD